MIVAALGVRVPPAFAPIVYLGKISYGLYVFHSLFIEVVNRGIGPVHSLAAMAGKFLLAFSLTILGAVLSYRLFESPFIRMKERFAVGAIARCLKTHQGVVQMRLVGVARAVVAGGLKVDAPGAASGVFGWCR